MSNSESTIEASEREMVACKLCDSPISVKSKVCRHCQNYQTRGGRFITHFGLYVTVLAGLGTVFATSIAYYSAQNAAIERIAAEDAQRTATQALKNLQEFQTSIDEIRHNDARYTTSRLGDAWVDLMKNCSVYGDNLCFSRLLSNIRDAHRAVAISRKYAPSTAHYREQLEFSNRIICKYSKMYLSVPKHLTDKKVVDRINKAVALLALLCDAMNVPTPEKSVSTWRKWLEKNGIDPVYFSIDHPSSIWYPNY